MAVYYGKSGSGFNPLGILSTLSMMIPGAQAAYPFLRGAGTLNSAINGDWTGAAIGGLGMLGGKNNRAGFGSIFGDNDTAPVTEDIVQPTPEHNLGTADINEQQAPYTFSSREDPLTNELSNYLSTHNLGSYTADDEARYQALLRQYGLAGNPQSVGDNADMGTRFADNNLMGQRRSDADYQNRYKELLAQYNLSDMDWTNRRKRNGLIGGI